MGTMSKMRENTGVVLWILIIAFGVIWVLQDSGGLDVIGQTGINVGSVNGVPITYEEYSQAIDRQAQNYQNQTGESMPPQMLDQTRDRVFDQLVELRLRQQEMEHLGLEVTDSELVDLIQGDDPHAIITANFGDENGIVDQALLQSYIQDPSMSANWFQIESILRNERLREKLDKLLAGTVRVSNQDVAAEHNRRNQKVDVRFVSLRFTSVPDDSIAYDDSDLRRFYNDHRDEFERNRSYTLSYVTKSKSPTAEDSTAILGDVEDLRESFSDTMNDSLFLVRNGSERPYTDAFFRPDELDDEIANVVFKDPEVGKVVGPIVSQGLAHLIKILEVRPPEEQAVRARHILFRAAESNTVARDEALSKAQDVLQQLRSGADFERMAREFSDDPTAANGGDLGWFGPGRMVKPFEEAAFGAKVGGTVGPIATQFGYHLIEVTEKATVEAQIADFALTFRASVATLNRVREQLDDLQYFSEENDDFKGEAERRELEIKTVQIEAEQSFIPGIGISRALMNFLETADDGDVSLVIELDNVFLGAVVDEIQSAGYRSFEEVKAQLEPRLRNELKADILVARLREGLSNGFDSLADAVGTVERTGDGLSFSNMVVTGIGRDPKFVGTAMGLSEGETSGVVTGINSVYVINVTRSEDPGFISDDERELIVRQLLSQRQGQIRSQWITALREEADIVDDRRLFLQ
ncbi:MAG: peptidylprolyl isomerase [Bacteroidetes bacterium]|nr:MAG: peptidylprolyl isomerase [Bacteroidota bacterium]